MSKRKAKTTTLKKPTPEKTIADFAFSKKECEELKIDLLFEDLPTVDWSDVDALIEQLIDQYHDTLDSAAAFDIILQSLNSICSKRSYNKKLHHYVLKCIEYLNQDHLRQLFNKKLSSHLAHFQVNEMKKSNRLQGERAAVLLASQAGDNYYQEILSESQEIQDDGTPINKRQKTNSFPSEEERVEEMEEEEVSESSDDDNLPRSDLSHDYHPNRVLEYTFEVDNFMDGFTETASSEGTEDEWIAEQFNVTNSLREFQKASSQIPPKKISDMRLLATNSIYLFGLNNSESVMNYMDIYDEKDLDGERSKEMYDQIKDDLNASEGAAPPNDNIIKWANQLAQAATRSKDWFKIQTTTIPFLVEAHEHDDKIEMIAANALHRLALTMVDKPINNDLEDSYVHNIISPLFESVFRSDPLLSCEWANRFLTGSTQFKPDFVIFLQHSKDKYDIGVSEIKPPSNAHGNNTGESDLVKLGKEMAWMLNSLLRKGVEQPIVCGILVQGLLLRTFKMDLKYPQVYRLIELASTNLFESLQGASALPLIVQSIVQVKNIVKKTAIKTKKRAIARSNGEPLNNDLHLDYMTSTSYYLRKKSKQLLA